MLTLLLALAAQTPPAAGEGGSEVVDLKSPEATIAIIGASVSAGFGNAAELEVRSDVAFGLFVESTLVGDEAAAPRIRDFGDSMFFGSPRMNGQAQVTAALAAEPTVVVALDFLFWYAFGRQSRNDPRREKGLEEGLTQLERFDVPVVIGDLPDIVNALDGRGMFGKPLITRRMLPTDDERERMNERLAEWAKERENVKIVPLAMVVEKMQSAGTVALRGVQWSIDTLRDALQEDLLHPTVQGTIWTAMFVADALVRTEALAEDDVTFDPKAIRRKLLELTHEAREKQRKRDAARAARRERIKERRKSRADKFAA